MRSGWFALPLRARRNVRPGPGRPQRPYPRSCGSGPRSYPRGGGRCGRSVDSPGWSAPDAGRGVPRRRPPAPVRGPRRGRRSGPGSPCRSARRRPHRPPASPRAHGCTSVGHARAAPAPSAARSPVRVEPATLEDRVEDPEVRLRVRARSTPPTASRRCSMATSPSTRWRMNCASPTRQSISRSLVRNDAAIMRARLCIQPVAASWRIAASTIG